MVIIQNACEFGFHVSGIVYAVVGVVVAFVNMVAVVVVLCFCSCWIYLCSTFFSTLSHNTMDFGLFLISR